MNNFASINTRNESITNRKNLSRFFNEVSETPLLSEEEEINLFKSYNETKDNKIITKIIKHNLRFIVSVAKQYTSPTLELGDMISYATIGATKAAKNFDITRGFKFISYAVYWMRQAILKEIYGSDGSLIRKPLSKPHIDKEINDYVEKEYGHLEANVNPTIQELEETLSYKRSTLLSMTQNYNIQSLDKPSLFNEDYCYGSFIEQQIFKPNKDKELLDELISTLNPLEEYIVRSSFGIGMPFKNHESLAVDKEVIELNNGNQVARERIRQIKVKALKHMKNSFKC